MTQPYYPTVPDAESFLLSGGYISAALDVNLRLTLGRALAAKIGEWERLSGYTPFLCKQSAGAAVDTTRKYDPPGMRKDAGGGSYAWGWWLGGMGNGNRLRKLYPETGVLSVTSLTAYVTPTDPGTVLVQGDDFVLSPANAPADGRPYDSIDFNVAVWGEPQSIVIVGKFGFGLSLPDDVFYAILQAGCAAIMPQLGLSMLGPVQSMSEGGVTLVSRTSSGLSLFENTAAGWLKDFKRVMICGGYVKQSVE